MTRTPRHTRSATLATGPAAALVAALAACGSPGPDTVGSGDAREQITAGGIAVVVLDHLGQRAVRQFHTYEPEPGSVGLMIRLREGTRADNFAVTVYSPEDAGEFGATDVCGSEGGGRGAGDVQCRRLDDGTSVMTSAVDEGFSDDNADGMVVFGTAVRPDDGAAMAMYESHDDSPAVSTAEIEAVLTDPRLTWLTEPQVNRAGADVDLERLGG